MKTLIDRAIEKCGSVNELAKRLNVPSNVVSMMKSKRTITPETAAELAYVAGEDAREAAIQAIIDRAKGTRREGALREILGKGLVLGVAGLLDFSYKDESISKSVSGNNEPGELTSYTSWNVMFGISNEPKRKRDRKQSKFLLWFLSFWAAALRHKKNVAYGITLGCTSRV